jgi:choline-sulfatase
MIEQPCIMMRPGTYKYVYIHHYEDQLFDLAEDSGEWHNLIGDPAHAKVAAAMRSRILARFDPDAIKARVDESYRRRMVI